MPSTRNTNFRFNLSDPCSSVSFIYTVTHKFQLRSNIGKPGDNQVARRVDQVTEVAPHDHLAQRANKLSAVRRESDRQKPGDFSLKLSQAQSDLP